MKIVVYNLGCKVNKYECDCIIGRLRSLGHEVSEKLEWAQLYIINTCAVTAEAERKSRQCVGRCLKFNGEAKVMVMGCASQDDHKPFEDMHGVTFIRGTAGKDSIIERINDIGAEILDLPCDYENICSPVTDRTRMSVKIQDGCDNFCSYCLIPYLRGRSRSRAVEDVVAECESLSGKTKEIVLTGIDISSYGKNTHTSLTYLLTRLADINCRIRLGSLEASVISPEFLDACKGLRDFCPQFHLSLQSGSDSVLKRMNRHYTTEQYAHKVDLIRSYYPEAAITTDVIFGFPTESESDFQTTLEFLKRIAFSHAHIFGYSPRKGTAAAKQLKPLSGDVIKARCAKAQEVAELCAKQYMRSFVGKKISVLTETCEGGYTSGFSSEYIRCYIEGAPKGEIIEVKVKDLHGEGLLCEMQ